MKENQKHDDLGRRDFVGLSIATGLAAATASAAATEVVEIEVTIKTPDGVCDAVFIHPKSGSHPGVLIWPDAFGLRPALRDIGKRIAAEGYSVLVPNPFYRIAAYVAFLDAQKEVNKAKRIGTQGYCMGGPLVVKTAAALPDRIGAGASFHGGGLVTDQPTSPHLLAPKIKARMYFGIAQNDDARQPDAKDKLKEAFGAGAPAEIEVYPAQHGWCIPDMPMQNGAPIYNKPEAERAWGKLVALYKMALS